MKKNFLLILILILNLTLIGCSDNNNNNSIETIPEIGNTYWWNEEIFYEIFVRSFYDHNGDGKGDLKGLIEKLDYLNDGNPATNNDLGITAIWLMPVCQSPSYHGYDITDYYTIEQDYGTNQDFIDFINAAHQRGIKVIVDFVINHTSNYHPWFQNSAGNKDPNYQNWYRWSNTNPGYNGPWGQPVWHKHGNGKYYYGLFWSGMPDLNFNEPAVKNEIKNIANYWLTNMNVDGFRCDAVKYIFERGPILENLPETYSWWQEFHNFYKSIKPNAMAVGEAWDNTTIVSSYTGDKFDFCFEFDLATSIIESINQEDPDYLISQLEIVLSSYPYNQFGVFLTNHDQNRIMNQLGKNISKAKLAAALYLTLPGIPFIYYGEEIAMTGQKPDEKIRTPMQWNNSVNAGFTTGTPWQAVNSDYLTNNVLVMQQDNNSIWNYYRKLIDIRKNNNAFGKGTFQKITCNNSKVLAYLRHYNDNNLIVVLNLTSNLISNLSLSISKSKISSGNYKAIDLLSNSELGNFTVNENGGINNFCLNKNINAREAFILKLEKVNK